MKFEGSEKKFEIILAAGAPSLLDRDQVFWESIVEASSAAVLSKLESDKGIAYLLSESSLIVFKRRVVMITCGQTKLIDALLQLLDSLPPESVDLVVYERKNEMFPQQQQTTFDEDVLRLSEKVPGTSLLFGDRDTHYVSLFHSDKPYTPEPSDNTFELLMHRIDKGVCSMLTAKPTLCGEVLQRRSQVNDILPGFEIDDHVFEPCGYSLNALRDQFYYTLHITPECDCSYVSFETNYPFDSGDIVEAAGEVLALFKPESFAFVAFQDSVQTEFERLGYVRRQHRAERLSCGYTVHYFQFDRAHNPEEEG